MSPTYVKTTQVSSRDSIRNVVRVSQLRYSGCVGLSRTGLSGHFDHNGDALGWGRDEMRACRGPKGSRIAPFWGPVPDDGSLKDEDKRRYDGYRKQVAYVVIEEVLYTHFIEVESRLPSRPRQMLEIDKKVAALVQAHFRRFAATFLNALPRNTEVQFSGTQVLNWLWFHGAVDLKPRKP